MKLGMDTTIGQVLINDDARPVVDVYGDVVLTRAHAAKTGMHPDDNDMGQWFDDHCGESGTITIAEALATGDRWFSVCRVAAEAIWEITGASPMERGLIDPDPDFIARFAREGESK